MADEEKIITPRELLNAVTIEVASERHLDPAMIRDLLCRFHSIVDARAVIASRLFDRGIQPKRIARLMKLRPAQVLSYLRKVQKEGEIGHGNEQDRAARPPDPPLRHRRDRYRQNPPLKGVKIGRRYRVKFERRLTLCRRKRSER
jgi:DNA-binding CsgD family transcriptional regulator